MKSGIIGYSRLRIELVAIALSSLFFSLYCWVYHQPLIFFRVIQVKYYLLQIEVIQTDNGWGPMENLVNRWWEDIRAHFFFFHLILCQRKLGKFCRCHFGIIPEKKEKMKKEQNWNNEPFSRSKFVSQPSLNPLPLFVVMAK